jgi:hypothetical protein
MCFQRFIKICYVLEVRDSNSDSGKRVFSPSKRLDQFWGPPTLIWGHEPSFGATNPHLGPTDPHIQ